MISAGTKVFAPVDKFAEFGTRIATDPFTGARSSVPQTHKIGTVYRVGKVIRRPSGFMTDQLGRYMVAIKSPRGQPLIVLAREDELGLAADHVSTEAA